jgi:hypothetical protein
MSIRRTAGLLVYLGLAVAPARLPAQSATTLSVVSGPLARATPRFQHHKKLVATYDSRGDSTHLALVTHKGLYFFTIQRPRLTWSVTYPGRTPGAQPPSEVVLVFRTQEPQVALDSRLVIVFAGEQRLEVASAGAYSVPGVQTWSHFMRFPVPTAALAAALATEEVAVSVGGIRVGFEPDQVNALRDLLSRVGAWPTVPAQGGA